jgi:hypothetical protein
MKEAVSAYETSVNVYETTYFKNENMLKVGDLMDGSHNAYFLVCKC